MNLMLAVAGMLAALAIPASAQQNPLFGTWEIVEAQPAPWVDEDKHTPLKAAGQRMIKQTVSFAAKQVTSKHKALACKRAMYETTEYQADALFQGNLPEPNPTAAAARLGFKKGDVPSVDLRCSSGVYSYHFRDRNTVLTALSNVIYTLRRQ